MDIDEAINKFLEHLELVKGRSKNTISGYRGDLKNLTAGLQTVDQFTVDHVRAHLATIQHLSPSSRSRRVTVAKLFVERCEKMGVSTGQRMERIGIPKIPQATPEFFTESDALKVVNTQKFQSLPTPAEARSWAIMELLYGAGLRVEELCGMDVESIDPGAMKIKVRGKGSKDRVLPIGPQQLLPILVWLVVRKPKDTEETALFVGDRGSRINQRQVRRIVEEACKTAEVKPLSPHAFRHSCATHMIEGGADIRVVQEFLGHTSLDTTMRYTHVAMSRLIKVFQSAHPREAHGKVAA